jgi:hypothetical protein
MESLGGDQAYWVRFMAQHSAIVYFIVLCFLWALSPSLSYRFSELLETHAVNTYGQFLDENEEILKKLPPPIAAVEYYSFGTSDPFYAEFQTSALAEGRDIRRPGTNMKSLYDTFVAIRADEGDHVSTMNACLDPSVSMRSPSLERKILYGAALVALAATVLTTSSVDIVGDTTALTDGATTLSEGSSLASTVVDAVMAAATVAAGAGESLIKDADSVVENDGTEIAEISVLAAITWEKIYTFLTVFLKELVEFISLILTGF